MQLFTEFFDRGPGTAHQSNYGPRMLSRPIHTPLARAIYQVQHQRHGCYRHEDRGKKQQQNQHLLDEVDLKGYENGQAYPHPTSCFALADLGDYPADVLAAFFDGDRAGYRAGYLVGYRVVGYRAALYADLFVRVARDLLVPDPLVPDLLVSDLLADIMAGITTDHLNNPYG